MPLSIILARIKKEKWAYSIAAILGIVVVVVVFNLLDKYGPIFDKRPEAIKNFRDCDYIEFADAKGNVFARIKDRNDVLKLWGEFNWWFGYDRDNLVAQGDLKLLSGDLVVIYHLEKNDPAVIALSITKNDDVVFYESQTMIYRASMPGYCAEARLLAAKYANEKN